MSLDYLRTYARSREVPAEAERAHSEGGLTGDLRDIEALLGGTLVQGTNGAYLVVESIKRNDDAHGRYVFEDLNATPFQRLAGLSRDVDLEHASMREAVFLDTETTGLGMGAGTYVFLVGAGFLDADGFHVRQYFLRDPGEEEPFLEALHEFLQRFSILVTFNGKAFDWPLLESRYVGHRSFRRPPLDEPLHIDLLHPSRRLWKRRLESCALQSLERHILGIERGTDDVPGWLIPSLYFRYVHSGDARTLKGVFYHNLVDILSLAGLAVHIDRVLAEPLGPLVSDGLDLVCLARHFDREGDSAAAIACLEESLRRELTNETRREALERLAALYKRDGNWEPALRIWDELVDVGGEAAVVALVELAKFYEHVEREHFEALQVVQRAINLLELDGSLSRIVDRGDLEHRRSRLMDRLLRQRRRGGR